ncbi:hypothetical protein M1247_28870 [Mycobacterium sp. 21AC1]|uniref:hypothetical protein n=1 Tax=[Mycobacterium] appelbergii TaxID=2939269 RepID=UPI002938E3B7|nr:hypothetical protein [Mycobacterium sp. 21AC1]MDV3128950.1 hypothetical protein [Mycobacterium sp. 21AC1]
MFLRRTVIGAVLIAAPLAFAAPAMAQPTVTFDCAPCVGDINGDGTNGPVWNEVTSLGPWEPFFDATDGVPGDGEGAWEKGVKAVNGGAWEKAFPAE